MIAGTSNLVRVQAITARPNSYGHAATPSAGTAWTRPTRERGRPARMHSRCMPLSMSAMRQGATPRVPSRSKTNGKRRPTRERGRLARMHSRCMPLSMSAMRQGATPRVPSRSKTNGKRRPTRERGRPARMHCRIVPLSFPAMAHPATLPAETAWALPKQGLTPLPVEPSRGDGRGIASVVRAGRPRSPVCPHPMTSSQHLAALLTGRRSAPSRCCSTSPREAARTANRSGVRRSAAPPVRR